MSLTFSNICSIIDDNCGTSSTSFPTATKTRYINLGIDNLLLLLFSNGAGGTWQYDDYNHSHYPIITTNLVSGQRDYHFTTDEDGALILDIYKAQVKDQNGVFHDLTYKDMQGYDPDLPTTFTDGEDSTGTPTYFDLTANGIFLDLIPSYNSTNGLRLFINREAHYFEATDTTQKLGFSGIYHEYLVLYACYQYARAKSLESRETFKRDLQEMEERIKNHSYQRERNVAKVLKVQVEDYK